MWICFCNCLKYCKCLTVNATFNYIIIFMVINRFTSTLQPFHLKMKRISIPSYVINSNETFGWVEEWLIVLILWELGNQHIVSITWWRHQMETFSALLAICAGNGEFPAQRPVTRNFDVFFDLRPNKLLSKQSWGWWFETRSRPLWRHPIETVTSIMVNPNFKAVVSITWLFSDNANNV